MTISLAFLAPDLVKAAIEGRLPRGIGMTRCQTCRQSGRFNAMRWDWLLSRSTIEPVSAKARLRFRETEFSVQRNQGPKPGEVSTRGLQRQHGDAKPPNRDTSRATG
jgi:hypothetical protein